jgi:hypothetical protein
MHHWSPTKNDPKSVPAPALTPLRRAGILLAVLGVWGIDTGGQAMSDRKSLLGDILSGLKQQRDELALRAHLGKAEAKDQWDQVRQQLDQLTTEYEPLKNVAEETTEGVISGLELTAAEVKRGLDRVAALLREKLADADQETS